VAYEYDFVSRRILKEGGVNPDIFRGVSGYVKKEILMRDYANTYGELMGKGMIDIWNIAVDKGLTHVFLDIGCGVGKCLVWAVALGFRSAIGIELVRNRYESARAVKGRLPTRYKKAIELYNIDILDYKHGENGNGRGEPAMIFISNIMWSEDVNRRLFKALTETYPRGSYIISSAVCYKDCDRRRYKNEGVIYLPMSWDRYSVCHKTLLV
jgi:SAM-dependent methyltransferase